MGRRPSEQAHERVLEAAGRLFAEQGIDATSMDAIAEASGVSKATIYKHWADKPALCLEVISHLHGPDEPPPLPQTDDIRADIVAFLDRTPPKQRSDVRSRMMPHLWAYAMRTPAFGQVWRVRMIDPPRMQLVALLRRAVDEGALDPDLDLELAAMSLLGPIVYRNLLLMTGGQPPGHFVEHVVDTLFRAHGVAPRPRRAPRDRR